MEAHMRIYNYKKFGSNDKYGQPELSADVKGQIKIAISLSTESFDENSLYSGAQYVGLTQDKDVNSSYVIQFGEENLKVLYVIPGRLKQVFLERM